MMRYYCDKCEIYYQDGAEGEECPLCGNTEYTSIVGKWYG